jgi:O-acetylhomoserine/O-acetylserine sulfhydrylase-like pyridoxal-dependent enzyme
MPFDLHPDSDSDLSSTLTTAVRGGLQADSATGALLTPIYQSTTYRQDAVGVHKGFTYSRAANPTV